ncbi:MAG: ABC transporter substrate-binding protein, partial [Ignisphaera sp.]
VIESIIVYNSSSFALKLRRPFAPLIEHLAHLAVAIMPRTVVEKYGSGRIDSAADVIGTGPYRVVEYLRGQYVRLQRFNGYWRGEPRIESIVYTIVPDPNARIAAIETGQIDIATGIPPEAVKQLELKGLRIYRETGVRLVIVAINTQRIPDLRIRQAMNYAVDRRAIVDTMMMGFAAVANSIVSPIFPGAASLDSYSYSPEKARQLIDEAGGVNRRLALLVSTRSPKDLELAQVVQSFLSSVGIDVEIQAMEHTAFLKKVFTEHDFDLAIYGPSPSSLYYALTYWRSGAALNAPLYSNPEVDKLLDEVTRESDRDRQYEIYRRIQEIIWFECPAIWLYYEDIIVATRPGVEDLRILPFQMLILDSITIKG